MVICCRHKRHGSDCFERMGLSQELTELRRHSDPSLTFKLAALFSLIASRRKPIIALDLVLRRPITTTSKLARPLKKQLLKGVSHFVHYFRQWDGYEKYFGIAANRSSYVPFKTDIRERFPIAPTL